MRTFMGVAGLLIATGSAQAQTMASEKPKVELQIGYQHQTEYEGDTLDGGMATLVVVNNSPVSLVVRGGGLYRSEDSRHFSGTVPVTVDGYTRMITVAGGGRLQGRVGRLVPHVQVLVGLMHQTEKTRTEYADVVLNRQRSSLAVYGDAGAGLTVYLTPAVGIWGNAGITPILGGFHREVYGSQVSTGVSITFR